MVNGRLAWRESAREDRQLLQDFSCCAPPEPRQSLTRRIIESRTRKSPELIVQSEIRSANPACDERSVILLGFDADTLVAVASAQQVGNLATVQLEVVAVAVSYQRRGFGREALDRLIDWAVDRADQAETRDLIVLADFDLRHTVTPRLLRAAGFAPNVVGAGGWFLNPPVPPRYPSTP